MEHAGAGDIPTAPALAERLRSPLADAGLSLSALQIEQVARFLALLMAWNARVNLTGARSAQEVVTRHLPDSLAVARHLPRAAFRLIDVGAGAGFLGLIVAILRPDAHCTLLEPIGKKHAFLRAAVRELPLGNVEARAERLEAHVASPHFAPYEVAASRATWPPLEWLERALPLLAPGGVAIAYEGREPVPLPSGIERAPYQIGTRSGALLLRRA